MTLENLKQAGWIDKAGQPGPVNPFHEILKDPDPVELSLGLEAGEIGLEETREKAAKLERTRGARRQEDPDEMVVGQLIQLDSEGREKPSFAIQTKTGQVWGLPFIDPDLRKRLLGAQKLGQASFNRETLRLDRIELDGEELSLSEDVGIEL
jgi:hypothetical protein